MKKLQPVVVEFDTVMSENIYQPRCEQMRSACIEDGGGTEEGPAKADCPESYLVQSDVLSHLVNVDT